MEPTTHNPQPISYRVVKVADPRSRGLCYWFEIEAIDQAGGRHVVAIADHRDEARDIVRELRKAISGR